MSRLATIQLAMAACTKIEQARAEKERKKAEEREKKKEQAKIQPGKEKQKEPKKVEPKIREGVAKTEEMVVHYMSRGETILAMVVIRPQKILIEAKPFEAGRKVVKVLTWRQKTDMVSAGFAQKIIFGLPEKTTVVADPLEKSTELWAHLVEHAIVKAHKLVFLLWKKKEIIPVRWVATLNAERDTKFGAAYWFSETQVVICL